ncbi:MAG: helix-turn-helix transcriptional regulator [Treponema sp.]|nr:helix-turn-helix transcriptional regulator [Treponema sp.]
MYHALPPVFIPSERKRVVADRLQITAPFLAQIESGKRGTSLEVIESIADIFDIPIAFLFLEQAGFPIKMQPTIRTIELRAIEKQLQEAIAENISFAFKKLI